MEARDPGTYGNDHQPFTVEPRHDQPGTWHLLCHASCTERPGGPASHFPDVYVHYNG